MKQIRKIMACVDLSDYSKETIDFAVAMARGLMTEILLFNVVNARDVEAVRTASHYYPERINVDRYVKEAKTDRLKRIDELINEHYPRDRERMEVMIRVGIPFEEILKAIDTEAIDAVVIGNKGRGNLVGTLLGSNAEKVFRHSPVPVISVRSRERFGRNR